MIILPAGAGAYVGDGKLEPLVLASTDLAEKKIAGITSKYRAPPAVSLDSNPRCPANANKPSRVYAFTTSKKNGREFDSVLQPQSDR